MTEAREKATVRARSPAVTGTVGAEHEQRCKLCDKNSSRLCVARGCRRVRNLTLTHE